MEETQIKKRVSIRGRVIISINTFCCLTILLMQRVNLNVVIPQIVTINNETSNKIHWTATGKSLSLMSIYIGFCTTQIIGGILAEKYGSKILLTTAIIISSITCIVSPFALERSITGLVIIRIIMGIAQGFYYPCVIVVMTNWFQPSYRSTAIGLVFPGTQFGTILALSITSVFAKDPTLWRVSFYLFGGIGFVWLIFWIVFVTDDPKDNKWVKSDEKLFLDRKVERTQISKLKNFPLLKVITSVPILAVVTFHFAAFWATALIFTIIPSIVSDLFLIEIKNQTYISFLAPVLSWIGGTSSCAFSDFLLRRKILPKLKIRKLISSLAMLPTGLFFILATLIPPEKYYWGVFMILLGSYFSGFQVAVIMPNIADLVPQYCGIVAGISNMIAAFAAIIGIQSTYSIVSDQHKPSEWQISFGIMFFFQVIGFFVFNIFAQGNVQTWAVSVPKDETPKVEKTTF